MARRCRALRPAEIRAISCCCAGAGLGRRRLPVCLVFPDGRRPEAGGAEPGGAEAGGAEAGGAEGRAGADAGGQKPGRGPGDSAW